MKNRMTRNLMIAAECWHWPVRRRSSRGTWVAITAVWRGRMRTSETINGGCVRIWSMADTVRQRANVPTCVAIMPNATPNFGIFVGIRGGGKYPLNQLSMPI
jgi:hypothetical protein